MSEKEGILRMQSSGRWAVCRPGRDPIEIMSGELFRVEVDGELRLTRMEEVWGEAYYSIDLYPLRDGMRAAIGAGEGRAMTYFQDFKRDDGSIVKM